jgi:hypothetical protein
MTVPEEMKFLKNTYSLAGVVGYSCNPSYKGSTGRRTEV